MIHVIAPGFSSSLSGGGGTSLFRGVALAAGRIGAVRCHEIAASPLGGPWRGEPGVEVTVYSNADALLRGVASGTTPCDTVIKFSGVDWGRDSIIDLWLYEARRAGRFRVVYADADGPSRLPFLVRHISYLPRVLDRFDGLLLFGGGARAVHEYSSMTRMPVEVVNMALTALPFLARPVECGHQEWDIAVVVGQVSAREIDTCALINECRSGGFDPRIAAVGAGEAFGGDLKVQNVPACDALDLASVYANSRFTLNTLRHEARSYPHVPSCRLFEAAVCGSVVITEPFVGLSAYLAPDSECLVFETGRDIGRFLVISEHERYQMSRTARNRVVAEAMSAAETLADIVRRLTI